MTWTDDTFTAPSLGAQWTQVKPDGDVHYPGTGNSSVALLSNSSGNSIWVTAAQATRLEQLVSGVGDFEIFTSLLDIPTEAGLFVRGSTITQDFVKFGRFGGQFTMAWAFGGVGDFKNGDTAGTLPNALRLKRVGDVWTAYYATASPADSIAGITWTQFDVPHTAAFTVAGLGLYDGGADACRFDYAFSTLASVPGMVNGTGAADFGGLGSAVSGKRTVSGSGDLSGAGMTGNGQGTGGSVPTMHHPSSTLVMVSWLRQIVGLPAAATLPQPADWFQGGFLTVTPVGGNPDVYNPERAPVFQVDCWAANPAAAGASTVSRKTPLQKANELADTVVLGCYSLSVPPVELPVQFLPVWIESVVPISEVRWIPEPDNSYAHFSVDVQIRWAERAPAVNL